MIKKTILALAAIGAGTAVYAQESNSVSFTLDNTVASEYIFRGKEMGDLSFQPSLEAKYGDFYAGVWASFTENFAYDAEVDFYSGYSFAINENLSLDVGGTFYYYSNGADDSTFEPFIGLNTSAGGFTFGLYYYYDLQIDDSTYEGSVGYSLPLESLGTSLDFSANLGYVTGDGVENAYVEDSYYYYGVGVSVPYKISENATLTAGVKYTDVSEDVINDGGEITYSVGLSVGF